MPTNDELGHQSTHSGTVGHLMCRLPKHPSVYEKYQNESKIIWLVMLLKILPYTSLVFLQLYPTNAAVKSSLQSY